MLTMHCPCIAMLTMQEELAAVRQEGSLQCSPQPHAPCEGDVRDKVRLPRLKYARIPKVKEIWPVQTQHVCGAPVCHPPRLIRRHSLI